MGGSEGSSAHGDEQLLELDVSTGPEMLRELRGALDRLRLPQTVRNDARLLLTELASNSVRHAGLRGRDPISVRARWDGARLRVDVQDGSRRGLSRSTAGIDRPSPTAESGWGLYLVDRLAARWGTGPGRHWFELERSSPGPTDRA